MLPMIARRLVALIPLLLVVSFGVFMLTALVPGDPAITIAGGPDASPERIAQVRDALNLDDPLALRYIHWLGHAVQLDFGQSLYQTPSGPSVTDDIGLRMPVTFSLAIVSLLIAILIGLPLGVLAGMKAGSLIDRFSVFSTSLGIAMPNFWIGLILISIFSVKLGWFPSVGYTKLADSPGGWIESLILPGLALGLFAAASIARQLRAALIDVLQSNYVRTAWAKGSSPLRVVAKHALKNAAMPTVTVIALQLGSMLGGAVIIEQIFSLPGLGTYLITALLKQDIPAIQGVAVMFVLIYVVINLAVDIVYGYINPKVRVS
jgi:peptide/nickel transport system permease protein